MCAEILGSDMEETEFQCHLSKILIVLVPFLGVHENGGLPEKQKCH